MKKFFASLLITILMLFGWVTMAGACWLGWYQSEMPQKQQKN